MVLHSWKKVKQTQLSSIYLIYGTNTFLLQETRKKIIEAALNEEERSFNLSTYDLEEVPVDHAVEDAETLPFFGEKRVVVLNNALFLTAEKLKGKVEHNIEKLQHYIEQPSPFTVMVINVPYSKLDERKKITKLLKKHAEIIETNELGEQEIRAWIDNELKASSVTMTEEAKQLFLQLTGLNLTVVLNELQKLVLYVGEGQTINEEIVSLLVSRSLEQNVFSLIEAVVQQDSVKALYLYRDLLQNNEEPIKILSLLAMQFRLIYHSKQLSNQGYGQQQIAQSLKIHPFRVKLALQQSKMFGEDQLRSIMKELAEADYEMKMGKMDKSLILELFFLKNVNQKRQ
ncbi:DNA polymerase III subunit delta [Bacillus songklensis]|uniref:DNA polymerase III subunit delta n=1 Tax=Bacillus songklensis TaxID=1069116 RepID=A0ABV8AYF7_9BACI